MSIRGPKFRRVVGDICRLLPTGAGCLLLAFVSCLLPAGVARGQNDYPPGPDSMRQPGVPQGEVKGTLTWQDPVNPPKPGL